MKKSSLNLKLPDLYPGFESISFISGEVTIFARKKGSGPPLVLLHGFPQTNVMWHKIAPVLARYYTVIIPDLRGYGNSLMKKNFADYNNYSQRMLANDILILINSLGYKQFKLVGHGLGGRVSYRLAIDHPDRVAGLAIVDTMPNIAMWQAIKGRLAIKAIYWLFLSQAAPLPENMITTNPVFFVNNILRSWTANNSLDNFDRQALQHYQTICSSYERIAAICCGYRASIKIDDKLDREDLANKRKITAPTILIGAKKGTLGMIDQPTKIWSEWCENIVISNIDCGHFIIEERPKEFLTAILPFFARIA